MTYAHAYHSEYGYIAYIAHTYTVGEGEPDLAAIAEYILNISPIPTQLEKESPI